MERKYPDSAWRRAVKEQEVILKALSGEIPWVRAADILGITPRAMRYKRRRYQGRGFEGILDGRRGRPSSRSAPYAEVEGVLRLWREEYPDVTNVAHFHDLARERHGLTRGYTWTKNVLQAAGCVKRRKGRGGHRQRRERRALAGQMVHLDGSEHEWLTLRPGERQTLLLIVDDATGTNLAARLEEGETVWTCFGVTRAMVEAHGIPAQLYTDRDSVYWLAGKGGRVDRERLTQFGRAMKKLGVEMIPGYSPQARGRGERWNGTWQSRLPAELRHAGIATIAEANRYIAEVFLPDMNRRFAVPAREEGSAFVSAGDADLDRIFCLRHARVVARDNTVRVENRVLQLAKSPYRATFARCRVEVLEHRDGGFTVLWNRRTLGRYDAQGRGVDRREEASGLSHLRPAKGPGRAPSAPAPSPAVPRALGSLPSGALSSRGTRAGYETRT